MATTVNQKVYVSPGVYTSETDLSFVAQSVGVTTLGLVGETLKGPAFEPVFLTNYEEFEAYFGGTQPTKFVNTQIPKYEAAYIAKSYLQQSNQLFVTRILGLSGYDAGPSWSIRVVANANPATIDFGPQGSFTAIAIGNVTGNTFSFSSTTEIINSRLDTVYTAADGNTSTLNLDIQAQFNNFISLNPGDVPPTDDYTNTAIIYGSIQPTDYDTLTGGSYTNIINPYGTPSGNYAFNDLEDDANDVWYYANFNFTGPSYELYSGYSFFWTVKTLNVDGSFNFTGNVTGQYYTFEAEPYENYNNMVVATLRSRGISLYDTNNHGPLYEVSGLTDVTLNTSDPYSSSLQNPLETFLISGVTKDNDPFSFETSLSPTSSMYITKVFGADNFGKNRQEVPLFVEESYPGSLLYAYNMSYIRGINPNLVALPDARSQLSTSIAYNVERYQAPKTPFLVSELRGNKVYNLFRFISISDGNDANTEVKISIANLSFNNMTFDVLIRDFFDTDASPVVVEKFTNCNMDPQSNSFIAKKIGTFDGEYALISKYVMVEIADEAPIDAIPCGFNGYIQRVYGSDTNISAVPKFKTQYYYPGQVIYSPPFNLPGGGVPVESSGDLIRRNYLGFSSQFGIDESFLSYKGKVNPSNWVTSPLPVDGQEWNYISKGFHMDSGATVVDIANTFADSGKTAFECGVADFTKDPESQDSPYYFIYSRKFTVCMAGGFDGWDIYREHRTNSDRFQLGSSGFLAGSYPSQRYPNANGDGLFKRIVVDNNTQDFANTDYYAYLLGILTFNNPEATNINIFATSSIDYVNNSNLVEETIDMIQFQRADSVYIATTPDYNMFTPDASNPQDIIYSQEAVDNLDNTGIDSNYTATYYPWILVRDTVNNTQIYLPPTGEVCRNLALTDNIAFPWFASAGYTRGLVNSIKARVKLTQEDRDTLYQGRINPIATFADVGTVIWGNKTLQVADSALNRLNVRRLLLQARKLISAVAVRLLFEQNDQIVRQQFLDSVNPILDSIRRDRGLYDFRVTVSSSPEDLDRNTLTGKIYLKPTKALEFIDIEFLITPSGASFENI